MEHLNSELRHEHRLQAEESIFLQVAASSEDGTESPAMVVSHSMDISASGLQMVVDQALPIGSIYPACVVLKNPEGRFQLIAEVKWVRPEVDQWRVGLALFESEDTDIEQWKEVIAVRCTP